MRIAIIADGGFLIGAVRQKLRRDEDERMAESVHEWLTSGLPQAIASTLKHTVKLFRVYYYDCYPYKGKITNPFTGYTRDAQDTNRTFYLRALSRRQNICFRAGRLSIAGWKLKRLDDKISQKATVSGEDIEPNFLQKAVDTKITIDVLELAYQKTVDAIVFITADSDFVPLMERVREKGILVYLCGLGRVVAQDLLEATDMLFDTDYDVEKSRDAQNRYEGKPLKPTSTTFYGP